MDQEIFEMAAQVISFLKNIDHSELCQHFDCPELGCHYCVADADNVGKYTKAINALEEAING